MNTLALAIILLPLAAQAQQPQQCGDYVAIAKNLKDKFHETRIGVGLASDGNAVAIFATPDGATYTIIRIAPAGPACIVSAGTRWELTDPPPAGDPA
jgi:hypothetical protein